jgi:hypothetical protein
MKQRLGYVCVLALAMGGFVVTACGDDSSGTEDGAGNGGVSDQAGSETGGTSNKAGSAGKGGGGSAGKGGGGSAGTATVGGAPDGGTTGMNDGGGGNPSAGGDAGGAGGGGGAGEHALVYACGSDDQFQKTCSAWVAADCPDATDCADCVDLLTTAREDFQNDPPCAACNAKYDAFYQCQIDAFESGDLGFGVECVDDFGADGTANCYPFLDDAVACEGYVGTPNDCPATWPMP